MESHTESYSDDEVRLFAPPSSTLEVLEALKKPSQGLGVDNPEDSKLARGLPR